MRKQRTNMGPVPSTQKLIIGTGPEWTKAFTLVELIVVITILAILWTIAFISLQWYSASSRDSVRISDVSNMKTSLELFHLNAGKYPLPDNNEIVSYSGDTLWYQWILWDTVRNSLSRNLNEVPKDPLSELEYVYSVSNNRNEFQILNLLEDELVLNIIPDTNAANSIRIPRIGWTYNGLFVKTAKYIVPTPSIITALDLSLWAIDLKDNPSNIHSQVVEWWKNIPKVWNIATSTWNLDWLVLSVYEWTINKDSLNSDKALVMQKIQDAYTGSSLATSDIYKYVLSISWETELAALLDTVVLDWNTAVATTTITCDSWYTLIWSICTLDCPTGFILVPWNSTFSTTDFCVAKYEMSFPWLTQTDATWDWNTYSYLDNAGTKPAVWSVVSAQWNSPIAEITQPEAIAECNAMWAWYHLITNNEWMTIARNIEAQNINWSNGTVWSGSISNGISNDLTLWCAWNWATNLPTASQWATITWDTNCGWKNKHTLSNWQEVWDMSWNVWEHVNKANTIDGTNYNLWQTSVAWSSLWTWWDDDGIYTTTDMDNYGSSYHLWTASGMWNLYYANGVASNIFLRGAAASHGSNAGVFTLHLSRASTNQVRTVGFRCTK